MLAESPRYDTRDFTDVPALESVAVESEDGEYLTIFALNRGTEQLEVSCCLRDYPGCRVEQVITLEAEDLKAVNTADDPDRIAPRQSADYGMEEQTLTVVLPRYSWNVIRIKRNN